MSKTYFGYIRVSTAKQGTHGVSLIEQKAAIERYAERSSLSVAEWFEERETASKRGRPVFTRMLGLLRKGQAAGVVIHKIDRSARNLKDWADLGELIDAGVEVHFAADSLDLASRGGRLSADIQAVVAADYIRNLREEAKKGLYGRLKQGIYPFRAPLGYLNQGGGKTKIIDPRTAPFVRQAFDLYATGTYSLGTLCEELHRHGLERRSGGALTIPVLSQILNNPFYAGLIRIKASGQTFKGAHEPLISWRVYERVQKVLKGKLVPRSVKHYFTYRRLFVCGACKRKLIGERQKGHIYYRCHERGCPTNAVREEAIEQCIHRILSSIELNDDEIAEAKRYLDAQLLRARADQTQSTAATQLGLDNARGRLNRLTDAFVDGALLRQVFDERRLSLLVEIERLEQRLSRGDEHWAEIGAQVAQTLELLRNVVSAYETAFPTERRQILEKLSSNRMVTRKELAITLQEPFQALLDRSAFVDGALRRNIGRTTETCRTGNSQGDATRTSRRQFSVLEFIDRELTKASLDCAAQLLTDDLRS